MKKILLITIIFLALLALGSWWLTQDTAGPDSTVVNPAEMLGADHEGFKRATGPKKLNFPDDHGPHPGYRTEWWYYTGTLYTKEGRRFGYQFTVFRNQVAPPDTQREERSSEWATDEFYMAHVALSDIENKKHYHDERNVRGALGLAGARALPFRIWTEDWYAEYAGDTNGIFPKRINAKTAGFSLDLTLESEKPEVLHGDRGYERKGPDPGDASYYVSFTRMATNGQISLDEESYTVEGLSWMDHEWSTSALAENQEGWDWFSVQLDNGYDLMFYQIREEDGSKSPYSTVSLIDPDGNVTSFDAEAFELQALDHWTSPETGAVYPVKWEFMLPAEDISLHINTLFPQQEMNVSVLYYEGATDISGAYQGVSVEGTGYVEMTGY